MRIIIKTGNFWALAAPSLQPGHNWRCVRAAWTAEKRRHPELRCRLPGFIKRSTFQRKPKVRPMIKLAFVFLIIALIAGLLGLTGIAGAAVDIAMFLFIAALVLFAVLLVLGLTVFKKVT